MLRILEEPIISIFSEEHPEDTGPSETPVLVSQHVWESHSMQQSLHNQNNLRLPVCK